MTDFIAMVDKTSYMFITGPDVVKAVTHEEVSKEDLGGSLAHASRSGVAHLRCPDEKSALLTMRELLSYLPQNNAEDPPVVTSSDPVDREDAALDNLVPVEATRAYDIKELIRRIVDSGRFLEIQPEMAQNIVVGFARMDGRSIGIVANQPAVLAGVLDIAASVKAARFVRFCDCFNIPLLTLVDVPGFMPGRDQEHGGIIRHGAKLLYAFVEATVPKVTLITRKAYGGAYDVMASKHVRADINFAFPTAEIAVMGPEGAVNIIYREQLAQSADPEAVRAAYVREYREKFANPYSAASLGYVDEVIRPRQARHKIITALRMLRNKRQQNPPKKHGNIPL
jgi:propionyl-CoA carboxylase beta chain